MPYGLNLLKGKLWNKGLEGATGDLDCANSNACIQTLSNLALIFGMANDGRISALFSQTNARLYSTFLGIDNLIKGDSGCGPLKGSNGDELKATWADAYKKFVTDRIASYNGQITDAAKKVSASVVTNVNDLKGGPNDKNAGQVPGWAKFMENFNAKFQVDHFTFPTPGDWPNQPLQIQKRAGATDTVPACTAKNTGKTTGTTTTTGKTTAGATTTGKGSGPITCMADGAPWYSPTSWCECQISSTIASFDLPSPAPSGADNKCVYSNTPTKTITPKSTSAAPTNIPGQGGVPGCAYVLYPDGQACPYANCESSFLLCFKYGLRKIDERKLTNTQTATVEARQRPC